MSAPAPTRSEVTKEQSTSHNINGVVQPTGMDFCCVFFLFLVKNKSNKVCEALLHVPLLLEAGHCHIVMAILILDVAVVNCGIVLNPSQFPVLFSP